MTAAERVKHVRKKLGLTQEYFATQIGIKRASLSLIESGGSALTKQNIKLICLTFGINEEWLENGSGEMRSAHEILTEYEIRVLSIFRQLSPTAQRMLIEYADKLITDEQKIMAMARSGYTETEEAPASNLEISTTPPWEQEESDGDGKDSLSG